MHFFVLFVCLFKIVNASATVTEYVSDSVFVSWVPEEAGLEL